MEIPLRLAAWVQNKETTALGLRRLDGKQGRATHPHGDASVEEGSGDAGCMTDRPWKLTAPRDAPRVAGHILCLGILLAGTGMGTACADPVDEQFRCYPVRPVDHAVPTTIHGTDRLTRERSDDVLWTINRNRMDAAGHFILAEVGCGAGCIHLASVDALTGTVRWMPKTISNWPIRLLQPVRYRNDSRLIVVLGQLDERGSAGPFRYLLAADGFQLVPDDRVCRTR